MHFISDFQDYLQKLYYHRQHLEYHFLGKPWNQFIEADVPFHPILYWNKETDQREHIHKEIRQLRLDYESIQENKPGVNFHKIDSIISKRLDDFETEFSSIKKEVRSNVINEEDKDVLLKQAINVYESKSFEKTIIRKGLKNIENEREFIVLSNTVCFDRALYLLREAFLITKKSVDLSITSKKSHPLPEVEKQKHLVAFLLKIGVLDYLNSLYKISPDDNKMSRLIGQIIQVEDEIKIDTIRTYIRDARNRPEKIWTDPTSNAVDKLILEHGIRLN